MWLIESCDFVIIVVVLFFFFKQKTAYEMRISDWSSDVCSSDLYIRPGQDHCLRGHDDVRRAPAPRADAGGGEVVDGKAGRGTSRFSTKNPAPPDTARALGRDRCRWNDRG